MKKRSSSAGFTLVETLVAVSIFGLILTAIGLEFVGVVDHTLHTRADTDAESQARIAMSKVSTHMRAAYFDWTDNPTAAPVNALAVVSPMPSSPASPSSYVAFYRVSKGGLGGPVTVINGVPSPPYDLVTIQMSTSNPGELDEIITPQPLGAPSSPTPLAQHVSAFEVTPLAANQNGGQYEIKITVSQPSGHCVGDACTFTLDNVIYVGGQQ